MRVEFDSGDLEQEPASTDMTVVEAAAAMERTRRTRLLVRESDRFIGMLTEEDIVRRVLAAGRRPDTVRVGDVMSPLEPAGDGRFLLMEKPEPDAWGAEASLDHVPQGKCEECGDFCVDLVERDGLLVCGDCLDPVVVRLGSTPNGS